MHVYRYQYKTKKKVNVFVPGIVIGLLFLLLFFQEQKELLIKLKQEIGTACYEKMLVLCMPDMVYAADGMEQKSVAERLVSHFFPSGEQYSSTTEYSTQVESALSYEFILAKEASDENYVDEETGELVLTEGVAGEAPGGMLAEETAGEASGDVLTEETAGAAASSGVQSGERIVVYPREKLNDFDFLIQNFYQVDNTTTIDGNQLNAQTLLERDMGLTHDAKTPQILIYHTHSQEGYADSLPGDLATSVVGVGDYLTNILTEKYGLNVIHHRGTYDVEDRDHAYSKAGPALEQILAENPDIEVVIDLHRDGVREDTRLVTNVNGKAAAQIMFFNGLSRTTKTGDIAYLSNPYITDNLALSLQMQLAAAEYYPGFTRRVYLKGYRYNMHYCPKTLLVEVGAQTNTFGEALNAMEPLADILNKVLTGA